MLLRTGVGLALLVCLAFFVLLVRLMVISIPYDEWVRLQKSRPRNIMKH